MSSNINDNISLNIKHGQGLSQAIDTELDKQLHQDVRLGLSDWQSIFNIIKEEQVQANNIQFDDKDKDIKNGRHFVVSAGSYEIAKKTWNKILDVAKNRLGIQTEPQIEETAQNENIRPALSAEALRPQLNIPSVADPFIKSDNNQEVQTTQQIVAQILKDAGVDTDGLDIDDIARKYEAIKNINPDITDNRLNERISNYAKALKTHQIETEYANAWANNEVTDLNLENPDVTQAINDGDMDKFKAAFHQAAKEYIELYDNAQGDGKIDIEEFIAIEEKELGRKLTEEERKIVLNEAINRVAILDRNNDNLLDETEIAAYLWAMSKINDVKNNTKTANDITFDEWKTSQEAMGAVDAVDADFMQGQEEIIAEARKIMSSKGKTLSDLNNMNNYDDLNLTDEEIQVLDATKKLLNYAIFAQALENGYEGLK